MSAPPVRRRPERLGDVRLLCVVFAAVLGARVADLLAADPDAPPALPVHAVRIDVNCAPVDALSALPGVGPALASRIDAERRRAPFRDADDLSRVRGIGPVAVARLAPHVRFGPEARGR